MRINDSPMSHINIMDIGDDMPESNQERTDQMSTEPVIELQKGTLSTGKPNRTSIMHMGDAYNKRKIEREALRQAVEDYHGSVPLQYWYDSLRETDDGRFSRVDVNGDRTSKLAHRSRLRKR